MGAEGRPAARAARAGGGKPLAAAAGARALGVAALGLALVAALGWARYLERWPAAVVPGLATDSVATLLVALQASDCGSYDDLLAGWAELARRPGLRVVGAVLDAGDGDPSGTGREGAAVPFPVRPGLAGAAETLMLRMGYRATPFAVLLDPEGRVRMATPPLADGDAGATARRLAAGHAELVAAGRGRE